MSYVVSGTDSTTGEHVTRLIVASTEGEARRLAQLQGIRVTRLFRSASTQPTHARPADEAAKFENELETSATPYATYALLGANALVLLLMVSSGVDLLRPTVTDLLRWGARYGPAIAGGEWWRLLTAMFVHIGLQHLVYNMMALAYAGPTVERMLGHVGFLLLYLVAGLGAGLLSLLVNPLQVGAGASGPTFGIYAALLALVLRGHQRIPELLASSLIRFVLVFVGVNLLYSLMPGVGLAAHLGGLFIGFLAGLILARPDAELTQEGASPRNALLMVVAVLLLVGAVFSGVVSAGRGYANVGRLTELLRESNATMQKFKATEQKHYQQDTWETDFAAVIDHELLPQWRATREALVQVTPVPDKLRADVAALARYLQLREDAWQTLVVVKRESLAQMKRDKPMRELRFEAVLVLDAEAMRQWLAHAPAQTMRDQLRELVARYDDLYARTQALQFTPASDELDAQIERELLPQWRSLRKAFDQFGEPPKHIRTSFLSVLRAVHLHHEYWELSVASRRYELRKAEAQAMQARADDAARGMRYTAWSELWPLY